MPLRAQKSIRPFAIVFMTLTLLLTTSVRGLCADEVVSISLNNVSVRTALAYLQKEYRYSFIVNMDKVDMNRVICIEADGEPVYDVLARLFEGQKGVVISMKGRNISITAEQSHGAERQASVRKENRFRGTVTDESGTPLGGVVVSVNGLPGKYSVSDNKGHFELTAPIDVAGCTFSCVGFDQTTMEFGPDMDVTAVMRTSIMSLEDVVVVGYGVQNRRDVTTSISSMNARDFARTSVTDFREALAARMPGVQVVNLGGQPEGNVSVRIRGIQSATAGNDPLYVIDGIACDANAFANLDASDIESLEVLKDASSAAIYGSRGSCGVVLITTKRGFPIPERPVVTYSGQFTVSQVSKKYDLIDAYEFAQLYKESRDGSYLYVVPEGSINDAYSIRPQTYMMVPDILLPYLRGEKGLTDTDWQNEVFRTALNHKHSLSVSAKGDNYSYFVSGNYLKKEGIIIGSDHERVGLRANFDGSRKRLKYGFSFSPSYSKTHYISSDTQYGSGDGVVASMLMAPPIFPVYNKDGSYNWDMNGTALRSATVEGLPNKDTQANAVLNPVALAREIKDVRENINIMGNVYAGYEFIEGLEYKIILGGDATFYERNYYRPSTLPMPGNWKYNNQPYTPTAINNKTNYIHWNITNQLSFNRTFGDHRVNAVAVYEAQKRTASATQVTGTGTAGDDKITTTYGKNVAAGDAYNTTSAYSFASWLVRGQYSYKSKYMVSASMRGDASSKFAPDNRWGYFPAASIGWRISGEPWMQNASFVQDLKLRASVGQTGNAQINDYQYLALYTAGSKDLGQGRQTMSYSTQISNDDLGWEKNTQIDVGLDLVLFKNLLGFNADFYSARTTDMLFEVPIPAITGFQKTSTNIGSMRNRGVEITLTSSHKFFCGFSYDFSANWSLNRNKVLSLGGNNEPIIKEGAYSGNHFITKVGEPIGCYYLLVQDGIFHDRAELDSYPHEATTQVGDYRFVDVNGDGEIQQETDRAIVGNYMPDFTYGFTIQLGYKGLDIAANFQGVYGNEILNLERRYLCEYACNNGNSREMFNRFPYDEGLRMTRKPTGYTQSWISTAFLQDGSYFRLQNLTLGYTMPNKWFKKSGINNFRIYLQGSNLFTLTNYAGYNPEVNKNASDPLKPGEDYCSYPLQRSFTIGLSINL